MRHTTKPYFAIRLASASLPANKSRAYHTLLVKFKLKIEFERELKKLDAESREVN